MTSRADRGPGIARWLAIIGGGLVGAIVVLGLIGFAMSRAQRGPAPPASDIPAPAVAQNARGLAAAEAAAATAAGLLPSGRPIPGLLVVNGPQAGQRFVLRNGFSIGKQIGCDLVIEDGFTSSHHAQVGMDLVGNCVLYDRGSTNGTFVNGVPVREVALAHGATIRVGSTELRFLAQ